MKDKSQTITFWAICIYLFCYFAHVANFRNELTVIFGGLVCLMLVVQQKKIRIDVGICLLTITMISYYTIMNGKQGLLYSILYIPLVIYLIGNYAACSLKNDSEKEKKLQILIFVFVIGYTLHGILNSYMYYAGYVVPGTRRWQDFWSGEIVPGTQHIAYFLPALVMFLPAVICFKKRKWLNLFWILITGFFGYTSLVTKSRMSVVIFAIVFCVQAVLLAGFERKNIRKQLSNKKWWAVGTIILIALIAGIFAVKDSTVVVAFIENMGKGGGIINNIRFQTQRLVLQQLFDYPMGGRMMDLGGISHAHNTWLDMANAAGLIPFFTFTAYTIYTFCECIYFLRQKEFSTETKLILVGLYGAFFMYLTVEPALEASIHLVTPWIFVNGIVHGCLNKNGFRK